MHCILNRLDGISQSHSFCARKELSSLKQNLIVISTVGRLVSLILLLFLLLHRTLWRGQQCFHFKWISVTLNDFSFRFMRDSVRRKVAFFRYTECHL